ncbi:hypothetical protein [Streptomyces carpaticus]|uniref:Uncharacterized protein n=1 Tax=Streptomyces carpaticus TaxID=285558 RepID=A0ABV4ZR77_9ACTN
MDTPSAMFALPGTKGEPWVYAFTGGRALRKVYQAENGGPTENWKDKNGNDHPHKFGDNCPQDYTNVWGHLAQKLGDGPDAAFARNARAHLLIVSKKYALTFNPNDRSEPSTAPLPKLDPDFSLSAASEFGHPDKVLLLGTSKGKATWCVWDVRAEDVSKPQEWPGRSAVNAAFWGAAGTGKKVLRVYAGNQETAHCPKLDKGVYSWPTVTAEEFWAPIYKNAPCR